MKVDEAEDKNVQDSFEKDIVEYKDDPSVGTYQFILTPVELIVLKAIMKNNNQMIPWFRSFYNRRDRLKRQYRQHFHGSRLGVRQRGSGREGTCLPHGQFAKQ